MRKNPETKKLSGYYRLVESYRNHHGNVCVRTLLSAGFLDDLNPDQLNLLPISLSQVDFVISLNGWGAVSTACCISL